MFHYYWWIIQEKNHLFKVYFNNYLVYGAFNKAMLKQAPTVREYADALTLA